MTLLDSSPTRGRRARRWRRLAPALALAIGVPIVATAAPSAAVTGNPLDSTFDGDGKAVLAPRPPGFGFGTNNASWAAAWQPDGKLLVAGEVGLIEPQPAANAGDRQGVIGYVTRLNANGSVDTTFGTSGTVFINGASLTGQCGGNPKTTLRAIVLQGDKIVLAGSTRATASCTRDVMLVRLNANGSIDTTFGPNGNGISTVSLRGAAPTSYTSANNFSSDQAKSMVVLPDGKLLVGARGGTDVAKLTPDSASYSLFAVLRFSADGVLDPTFGGPAKGSPAAPAGVADYELLSAAQSVEFFDMTLDRLGRPILVGTAFQGETAAGTVISRFGAGGEATGPDALNRVNPPNFVDQPFSAHGAVYLRGSDLATDAVAVTGVTSNQFAVRYYSASTLTELPGAQQPNAFTPYGVASGSRLLAAEDDGVGRPVMVGETTAAAGPNFFVARLRAGVFSGFNHLDPTFAGSDDFDFPTEPGSGITVTGFGNQAFAQGLAVSRDGRLATVGRVLINGNWETAIAVYRNADVPPGAPANLQATPGNGQVVLTWSAPAATGGVASPAYAVTVNGEPVPACGRFALTCTVTNLQNGTAYTFVVSSSNAAGLGGTATIVATPAGPPNTTLPPPPTTTTPPPVTTAPTTTPTTAAVAQVPAGAGRFVPLANPVRFLDTRGGPKPAAGSTTNLQITGREGIPAGATAVVMNVTATETGGAGFVTAYPAGEPLPTASNLNPERADQNLPNLVSVRLGVGGAVSLYSLGTTHLIADVFGYYLPATAPVSDGRFVATAQPERLLDTRSGAKLAANGEVAVQITGRAGIPAGASAVVLNVTATQTDGAGFVTAYPSGRPRPNTSNVNYVQGQTIPNQVIVPVGADGRVVLYTFAGAHLIADVAGYFTDASAPASVSGLFVPQSPSRALDTRLSPPKPGTGGERAVNVPAGAAVVANVTATDADGAGYVTAFPGGTPPNASNLNLERQGQTIANHVIVRAQAGQFRLFTFAGSHLIADLNGYFTA